MCWARMGWSCASAGLIKGLVYTGMGMFWNLHETGWSWAGHDLGIEWPGWT
jgi:hypothetical protein